MADTPLTDYNSPTGIKNDIFIAVAVIAIVFSFIIPLPPFILDILMSFNLVLGILILLIVLYSRDALDFSVFPSILLVSTVFGLALNISSTRLILIQGPNFAGKIVKGFSTFVVGAGGAQGLVIGIIMFSIFIAVQILVITKGATRVSEVAARFALDGMPGKQMAIDAEFSSGVITEEEAQEKKKHLQKSVDFYGAMDGATKFVSGNVKAGMLITLINLIGGLIMGMVFYSLSFRQSLGVYTSLTIGDGLVSQLPALLISVATGMIVTRSISNGTFGKELGEQFSLHARVYWIASCCFILMAFIPGFPWYLLLILGGLTGAFAFYLGQEKKKQENDTRLEKMEKLKKEKESESMLSPLVPLDPISLELGFGLVPLVDEEQGAELLDRISRIRREVAVEMGLVLPQIRIVDNMRLEASDYSIKIRGAEIGRGSVKIGVFMAINPGGEREALSGEETIEPAFGLPAQWIGESEREKAERYGYTVVDSPSIIATHLTELIKKFSADILGRQDVKSMLDKLKEDYSAVVEEVLKVFGLGDIQKVLQGLLREQVSIRNLVIILETMADYGNMTKDVYFHIEKVRQALGRQISNQCADADKKLQVLTVTPEWEQKLIEARSEGNEGPFPALNPEEMQQWITHLRESSQEVQKLGFFPIILCSEAARPLIGASVKHERNMDLTVLSVLEISRDITVEKLGEVG